MSKVVIGGAAEAEIIRILSRLCHARRQHEVFTDFVEMAMYSVERLAAHADAVATTGRMAVDPPEVAERFARAKRHHSDKEWPMFAEALNVLMESAESDYQDVVGNVYMQFGWPSKGAGQFFTPFPLAQVMAQVTFGDGAVLWDRLNEGLKQAGLDILFRFSNDTPHAGKFFLERFGDAILKEFKPVTVQDPACGSGVMFLAAASCFPEWVTRLGLVQFYGMDLDPICVSMCRLNIALYGLNGAGFRLHQAALGLLRKVPKTVTINRPAAKLASVEAKRGQLELLL